MCRMMIESDRDPIVLFGRVSTPISRMLMTPSIDVAVAPCRPSRFAVGIDAVTFVIAVWTPR